MTILKKFIENNQNICNKIEGILFFTKPDITEHYAKIVAEYANEKDKQIIIDVGGGRFTPFAKYLDSKHKLIVIDENINELEQNADADEKLIADLNKELPISHEFADLIVSRYVFEHLQSLPDFILKSSKILKKDGYFIHLFSCKFALFALLNQVLPKKITNYLLNSFLPESNAHGFQTHYNYCYHDSIINIFTNYGFSIEKIYVSYYGSRYFRFFLPFYIISVFYEIILKIFGLRNLCAYILIITKKK